MNRPSFFIGLVVKKANEAVKAIQAEVNSSRRDDSRLELLERALDRLQDLAIGEVVG